MARFGQGRSAFANPFAEPRMTVTALRCFDVDQWRCSRDDQGARGVRLRHRVRAVAPCEDACPIAEHDHPARVLRDLEPAEDARARQSFRANSASMPKSGPPSLQSSIEYLPWLT